jgi:RNA polymerase sigma-70 factor, ECF subfamily
MSEKEIISNWNANKGYILQLIKTKIKEKSKFEDIFQEIFIKYWNSNREIKDKNKVKQWLISVSKNTITDYYRQFYREKDLKNSLGGNSFQKISNENNYSEEIKKLLPVIYSLPLKYRNILLLSEICLVPHKEISRSLNLSVPCIKSRVVRGRALLAERMKECCSFTHDKYGNIVNCAEKKAYFDCLKNLKKNQIKMRPV